VKREELAAGSKLNLDFPVTVDSKNCSSPHLLKWRIGSEGYDIGFQVSFKKEGSSRKAVGEQLVEYRRVDTHVSPIEGSLVCDKPGVYTLTIDNSYSKRRNKVVLHTVYLTDAEHF
jgi:hypothetical protein